MKITGLDTVGNRTKMNVIDGKGRDHLYRVEAEDWMRRLNEKNLLRCGVSGAFCGTWIPPEHITE